MTLHNIWLEVQYLYYHAGWRQSVTALKNTIYKNIKADNMLSDCSNVENISKIYEADICQKVKNIEAETKKHYSYKKKKKEWNICKAKICFKIVTPVTRSLASPPITS